MPESKFSITEIFEHYITESIMKREEFDILVSELLRTCQVYRTFVAYDVLLMKMARYLVSTIPDNIR